MSLNDKVTVEDTTELLRECFGCYEKLGVPTLHECKQCVYFICDDCFEQWMDKKGHFKCLYGCKNIVYELTSPIRYSNNVIVVRILSGLDWISDGMMKLLFSSRSIWNFILYILLSFVVTIFLIVPGMVVISVITIKSEEGKNLFKCLTIPLMFIIIGILLAVVYS